MNEVDIDNPVETPPVTEQLTPDGAQRLYEELFKNLAFRDLMQYSSQRIERNLQQSLAKEPDFAVAQREYWKAQGARELLGAILNRVNITKNQKRKAKSE